MLLAAGTGDVAELGQGEVGRPLPLEHAQVGEEPALDRLGVRRPGEDDSPKSDKARDTQRPINARCSPARLPK